MTLNRILWNSLIAPTVITIAISGCTQKTPNTQDLIAQSSKNTQLFRTFTTQSDSGYSVAYSPEISGVNNPNGVILASECWCKKYH
ncbi:WD-repeat protein (plasmid) [Nostoc sp. HK-01]|nr:WD-repeat protein [Nostoc sp. HK-01]